MKIKILCPQWGHTHLPLDAFFSRVQAVGYDGVDVWLPESPKLKELFFELFPETGLEIVLHQHQAAGEDMEAFNASFEQHLREAAAYKPLLINSHTGRDYFSFEDNCRLIETGFKVEQETGIRVRHETHRGRFTFSPGSTMPYFSAYPDFRITADFSHWCNVSESYLEGFAPVMEEAFRRADHVHARVGHPEGPQVSDPRAPEWREALEAHLSWWDRIVAHHRETGTEVLTFTCEFGPKPYMPTLPFKDAPVADQWEINVFMMQLLRERYPEAS